MDKKREYAEQWEASSSFFYQNNDYDWMANIIKNYDSILEIGSGTGYSTLSLVSKGHRIISIEKNEYCLRETSKLLTDNGYTVGNLGDSLDDFDVILLQLDISDDNFKKIIKFYRFDIIICWNIGSYWDKAMIQECTPKLLQYGLTIPQILEAPESSYSEYILWLCCKYGERFNVPVQIVDRVLDQELIEDPKGTDTYYVGLKEEFGFNNIEYRSYRTNSKSKGGRALSFNNIVCKNDSMSIYLFSILLK